MLTNCRSLLVALLIVLLVRSATAQEGTEPAVPLLQPPSQDPQGQDAPLRAFAFPPNLKDNWFRLSSEPCVVDYRWQRWFDRSRRRDFQIQVDSEQRIQQSLAATLSAPGADLGRIVIPVVVHIVLDADRIDSVTDELVHTQIKRLNADFGPTLNETEIFTVVCEAGLSLPSDCAAAVTAAGIVCPHENAAAPAGFVFILAQRDPACNRTTGIIRRTTEVFEWDSLDLAEPVKEHDTGGDDAWDRDHYLNIWVVDLKVDDVLGEVTGYSSKITDSPARDGIVIDYKAFGDRTLGAVPAATVAPLFDHDMGRTAVHETGHWLDLLHLWGGFDDLVASTCSGDCTTTGDKVCDTPPQSYKNGACSRCNDTCTGDTLPDLCNDYMDYPGDKLRVLFTQGQVDRMRATLATSRSALLGSSAHIALPSTLAATPADGWIADAWDDFGDEPDSTTEPLYASPDIWVRRTDDGDVTQVHESPLAGAGPQFVYVRVRNRGCTAASEAKLDLHWAKASPALGWPAPWDGSVTVPVLMGGLIGEKPVPTVPPGGSVVVKFEWTLPDLADFADFADQAGHVCLLARLLTGPAPGFGMTVAEGSSLSANVRNNNNIAWKNVWVLSAGGGSIMMMAHNPHDRSERAWILVRPGWRAGLPALTNLGDLVFTGQDVRGRIDKGARAVPGLMSPLEEPPRRTQDPFADALAIIGPFDLEPGEYRPVRVQLDAPDHPVAPAGQYVVEIQQWIGNEGQREMLGGGIAVLAVSDKR